MRIVPTVKITTSDAELECALKRFNNCNIQLVRLVITKHELDAHVQFVKRMQDINQKLFKRKINIMLDIPYPKDKIRFEFMDQSDSISFSKGELICIVNSYEKIEKEGLRTFFVEADFSKKRPERLIVGDGELLLNIKQVSDHCIIAECLNSTTIKRGKAIASMSGYLKKTDTPISEKTFKLISLIQPEICVLSYIETAQDVVKTRQEIQYYAHYSPQIMAKIECGLGLKNLDDILNCCDSVMIARGCLGVNVGFESLLKYQDIVIKKCKQLNIDVCVASNILRTLGTAPSPTRAEMCDLSHLISLGLDYIVITDGYGMTDKINDLIYYVNNICDIYNN